MSKKIIKFKQDKGTLISRAYTRYDKGDYPSALAFLYRAQKLSPLDTDIGFEIALIYGDMQLYDYQLKQLVKLLSQCEDEGEVYKEIIKCYFEMDLYEQAFGFYKEAIERGVLDDSFLEEFVEYDFEFGSNDMDIKLKDKRDNAKLLQLSHKLMLSGDLSFAKQLMETITPDSHQYIDATNSLAVIALSSEGAQKAIDYSQKALELDCDNVYAIAHCIIAYKLLEDNAKMQEYIDRLIALDLTKINELSVAAFSMQRIHNSELALYFLEKLIRLSPYSREYLITSAIANSNCGNRQRARELLVRANNIYPDDVTIMYYTKEVLYSEGKTDFEIISSLPDDVIDSYLSELEELVLQFNRDKGVLRKIPDDLSRKILWAFQSADWRVQVLLARRLVNYPEWESHIRMLLIEPNYDYRAKKEFLEALLLNAKRKSFDLFVTDMYLSFSPKIPSGAYPEEMRRAYWQVYTTLAFIGVEFDARLNKAFRCMIKSYASGDIFNKIKLDSRPISALLLYRVNLKLIFKNKNDCCEVFGCDLTDFETYNEIFPDKNVEKIKDKKPYV